MNYPLEMLSREELKVLFKLFEIKPSEKEPVASLERKLSKVLSPVKGFFNDPMDYLKFMDKIAEQNNIYLSATDSAYEKESELFVSLYQTNFQQLSVDEQKEFLVHLENKGLSKDQVASLAALSTLGAAQISGMGIYLLASSSVGAISAALNITLAFSVYTTMSSVISTVIGPIGFAIAAIPLIRAYKGVRNWPDIRDKSIDIYKGLESTFKNVLIGNFTKAEMAFNYLAGLRIMKVTEIENQIKELKNEINVVDIKQNDLNSSIHTIEADISELDSMIDGKDRDIEDLKSKINRLREEIDTIETSKRKLKDQQSNNRAQVSKVHAKRLDFSSLSSESELKIEQKEKELKNLKK
ncbi:hypothetical protein ACFQZJ_07020 [Maribacter chungangensis]|uniref:Uncharacterized protein n=1 Tax=Maribacter chungangensis TaxID=1069117 RepID=A0ABW3B3M9_9FLAO